MCVCGCVLSWKWMWVVCVDWMNRAHNFHVIYLCVSKFKVQLFLMYLSLWQNLTIEGKCPWERLTLNLLYCKNLVAKLAIVGRRRAFAFVYVICENICCHQCLPASFTQYVLRQRKGKKSYFSSWEYLVKLLTFFQNDI